MMVELAIVYRSEGGKALSVARIRNHRLLLMAAEEAIREAESQAGLLRGLDEKLG